MMSAPLRLMPGVGLTTVIRTPEGENVGSMDDVDAGLAMILRLSGASYWEPDGQGGVIVHVPIGPRGQTERRRVSAQQLRRANLLVETGVPPLRGELDPVRIP